MAPMIGRNRITRTQQTLSEPCDGSFFRQSTKAHSHKTIAIRTKQTPMAPPTRKTSLGGKSPCAKKYVILSVRTAIKRKSGRCANWQWRKKIVERKAYCPGPLPARKIRKIRGQQGIAE